MDVAPALTILDVAMRGGAATVSLFLAALLLAIRPLRPVSILGALFLAGSATYAIATLPPILEAMGSFIVPVKLFAMLAPGFFWLFLIALFDDEFEWRPWQFAPLVAIGALYLVCLPFPQIHQFSKGIQFVLVFGLMMHILVFTRGSLCNDLVASRRQLTGIIGFLVPLVCAAITVIEIYEIFEIRDNIVVSTLISLILFAVSLGIASGVVGIRRSLLPDMAPAPKESASVSSAADRFDLARLEDLVKDGVYLHPGLTIGELANRMNMPEHRMRRLINKGLGYRNFAAFLNDHRIDEAARRLSTPETARDQITSLAFDLGYSSLAPFNRAFRERLGMSPSQFREKALADL